MRTKVITNIFCAVALTASALTFGQTEVPNTFQAGQPARAADVNANFDELEGAVDANAAGISTNTSAIGGNASAIATNTTEIANNSNGIASNPAITSNNITEIQNNASGIAANEQSNAANSASIATNQAAIQANSDSIAAIPTFAVPVVQANGQTIGSFLYSYQGAGLVFNTSFLWVLSDTGYAFAITPIADPPNTSSTGIPGEYMRHRIHFSTVNCSGSAYVGVVDPGRTALYVSGAVFASEDGSDPTGVYYSPKGSTPMSGIVLQSSIRETGCLAEASAISSVIEIFSNDPLITGVPTNRNFDPPITLSVRTF